MSPMTATAEVVTEQQVETMATQGWIVLKQVLSPEERAVFFPAIRKYVLEVQAAGQGMDALPFKDSDHRGGAPKQEMTATETPKRTAFSLREAPPEVAQFLTSPKLGEIAARLLQVDAVRLMHFTGIFKDVGSAGTPLHQDLTNLPLDTDRALTFWIPLMNIEGDMAPMMFANGSHVEGQIEDLWSARTRYPFRQTGPLQAGDISIHMGWTIHGSLKNTSHQPREAFGISYYADGARIALRHTKFVDALMANCFAGLQPGELAAGPLNPVVYSNTGA